MWVVQIYDFNVIDVLVAKFQERIGAVIPQMNTIFGPWEKFDVHKAVENALSKLSEHGKISNLLT
jgi:hypothetical protein